MTFSITTIYHFAECRYTQCHGLCIVMLKVIMLSVVMLIVTVLNVVMMSVMVPF